MNGAANELKPSGTETANQISPSPLCRSISHNGRDIAANGISPIDGNAAQHRKCGEANAK